VIAKRSARLLQVVECDSYKTDFHEESESRTFCHSFRRLMP